MKALWGFCKWMGRMCWWVVFWPIGLWRSYRHGANKRAERNRSVITVAGPPESLLPPHWQARQLPIPPPPPPLPPNPRPPWVSGT